jgi:hypothetical protein
VGAQEGLVLIRPLPLPDAALLRRYAGTGAYTDCFATDVPHVIPHARYVEAFYTTPLFKLERVILKLAVRRPSSDAQARQLAAGTLERFAAWDVEQRADNQLLMCDMFGNTRSWLMVAPIDGGTRLYFGSAVVPKATGHKSFKGLVAFHKLYSRALLASARSRVLR